MRKEILKKSLKKIVSLLLVLTLIFGTGYSSYAQNTRIHLKLGGYSQLSASSAYVYITGYHGTHQLGVNEHVMVSSETSPPSPGDPTASLVQATMVKMTINGGNNQFSATDFSLGVNAKILYFKIGNSKYYIGHQIKNVGREGGNVDDEATAGGTMNYEITAMPSLQVSYNANEGTGPVPAPPTNYMAGVTVNVLGNLGANTKDDHVFTGWNTAADGSGTSYVAGNSFVMGFANVVLYAQWAPLYNVFYDGNGNDGGTAPTDSNPYKPGDAVTVATKGSLTKLHYTFEGWTTAQDGSGSVIAPSSQITMGNSDVTLYAKWKQDLPNTVAYDGNGATSGAVPIGVLNYYTGQNVSVLGNVGVFEKTGFTFIGWSTASDGSAGLLVGGSSFTMGTSDVVLYAQWLDSETSTFDLIYDSNEKPGGILKTVEDIATDPGTVVEQLGLDIYSNFKFMGWNTSPNGTGTDYAPGANITGTGIITLYAQWVPFFTVNYSGNGSTGGTAPSDTSMYFSGAEVTVLGTGSPTLVKTHHTFGGWNKEPGGTGPNYSIGSTLAMGTENITLYAKWIPDPTFNVIYNANGATSGAVPVDSAEYFTGDGPVVLGNTGSLALTGYSFNGWNTVANGSGTAYNVSNLLTMGSNDIILYAQWSLTPPPPPQETTGTTSAPTTEEPSSEEPSTSSTTASTEESTEDLTAELIPEGDAIIINFDEPLDSSIFEEVIELGTEAIPLAPALPQTGQLPVELFYGIGGLITAAGVFLRKNK